MQDITCRKVGSYSKAAEELYVSQPVISRTIKEFENDLNAKLFQKKEGKIILTAVGEKIFPHVEILLDEYEIIRNNATENKNYSISILANSASTQIQNLVIDFKKNYSNANIIVHQLDKDEYTNNKNYDLMIYSTYNPPTKSNIITLLEEDLCLIVPSKSQHAKINKIKLSDMKNIELISLSKNKDLRVITDYYFLKADTTPKICIENNAASVIRDYLKLGVGSAIIPTKTWKNIYYHNKKVKTIEIIEPKCKRYVVLETNKSIKQSKMSIALKNYIIENFHNYL